MLANDNEAESSRFKDQRDTQASNMSGLAYEEDPDSALINQLNKLNMQFFLQNNGREYTHLSQNGPM